MAAVTSLGIPTPAAVPYLIAEGDISPNAARDPSQWQRAHCSTRDGDTVEEELYTTDYSVIWSRAGTLQRVFNFETENEKISQAAFARFPSHAIATSDGREDGRGAAKKSPATINVEFPARTPSHGVEEKLGPTAAPRSTFGPSAQSRPSTEWAVVVVLKTQAHIFFLRGKSHIVHLPFEVDRIFPLSEGILLSRRLVPTPGLWNSSPSSKPPLVVPPNSFAFSQYGSQGYSSAPGLYAHADEMSPISLMLKKVLQQPSISRTSNLPRLFSLTDPLNQLGIVGVRYARRQRATNESLSSLSDSLDVNDVLLYVSAQDELGKPAATAPVSRPFALAATLNEQTHVVTVWQVKRVIPINESARRRQDGSGVNCTFSRRRSSRGPGTGTGTGVGTPTQRGANIRESFGTTRTRVMQDYPLPASDQISLSFDSAFDSPVHPAKSSRRVSSLLARTELSSSHDDVAFSEFAGGHNVNQYVRRGPSFGADPVRLSFARDSAIGVSRARPRRDVRTSIDFLNQDEPVSEEDLDDIPQRDTLGAFNMLDIGDGASSLHREYELSEIYTTTLGSQLDASRTVGGHRGKPSVFTLRSPRSSLHDDEKDLSVFLCLIDRDAQILLSLRIQVKASSGAPESPFRRGTYNKEPHYTAQVTNVARLEGVLDACLLECNDYTRVVVLNTTANGMGNLCLHAPWSAPHTIALPERLNVNDPTKIALATSPHQRREVGYKRVLSQSAQALSALFQVDGQSKIDVADGEGVRHRVHIQLQPGNPLVRKIISTCDAVMPLSGEQREMILSAWWAVTSWLRNRPDLEHDREWTALVVVLFSIPAGSIQKWHSEAASRPRRRKTGLLRSSSGANTDLSSWEAMLDQEAGHLSPSPSWMRDAAWQWVTRQHTSVETQRASPTPLQSSHSTGIFRAGTIPRPKKSAYIPRCGTLAREALSLLPGDNAVADDMRIIKYLASKDRELRGTITANLLVGLHLLREELKLDSTAAEAAHCMTPVLAQLGGWLGWKPWSFKMPTYYALESADMENWLFDDSVMVGRGSLINSPFEPPSIMHHTEKILVGSTSRPFMTLLDLVNLPDEPSKYFTAPQGLRERVQSLTPRTIAIANLFTTANPTSMEFSVENIVSSRLDFPLLETLPESIAMPIRSSISRAQASPSISWRYDILGMVGRDDLLQLGQTGTHSRHVTKTSSVSTVHAVRDVHTICASTVEVESIGAYDGSAEADRQSITRMIFKDDQRFAEAAKILHPLTAPTAWCIPEPAWSDTELLEAQQELVKVIATRTLSVSPGRSLLFYNARSPLLTEKFPIHGFTLSCVMKPTNTTVTADRNAYTEEKVSWAFFHAGVEAGLSISKDAKGITTSWLHFNKPHELKNRHAGFLLALGLNGHMKNVAKWASYKYLSPKHTMTSIGFLLGTSASYLGTMDLNIARLLSVHVKRMLPAGAAELNLSPITQTGSIMGIGLLYYNTQHRRMSEIMLSEIENAVQEENGSPSEDLRNEGYRLAAGFALGFINLGRGMDLKGLHDMQIVERLLVLAVGTKKADLVHVLDKATAAATVAIALVFMKTGDATLARKIDVPDTLHQFDYVRPDILLLRTVARHLIMWDQIRPSAAWMHAQLPLAFQNRRQLDVRSVSSQELPYMNVLAGLCLSLGLRYAGTGLLEVRSLLCRQLDQFMLICRLPSTNYDRRLTRITARNCQDTVALAAACVMAGTGDLQVFRRLRALHGRADAETTYGSHLAAHLAIGVLFLGGGTHSFGTSNVAVASLLCAFYPLFPTTVLDNRSHLQAFRHFWVLAAEPRCLVVRDVDTHRPLSTPMTVELRNGTSLQMTAPCLLPDMETITSIGTADPAYWPVNLDFGGKPFFLPAFKRHQTIYVRRRAAGNANVSVFSTTLVALNDAQAAGQLGGQLFNWIFTLPIFDRFDRSEQALVLPADLANVINQAAMGTAIDDSLVLTTGCMESGRSERLWNLRLLFAWADTVSLQSGHWAWLKLDVVTELRAKLCMRLTAMRDT
ncbi:MAG: hypothetical protein LQ341_000225 [Variospora aurantia]|nr:MAG: hypothetical protein LQ341_000225 [Variospora aurantia]